MIKTDKMLLEAIAQKDQEAFTKLYNRYWKLLYVWAKNRIYDQETVRDLMQNVWMEIWQKPVMIKTNDQGSARSILLSFVTFRTLDQLRKKKLLSFELDEALNQVNEESYSHILEEIELKEIHEIMNQTLAKLPDLAKNIYMLSEKQHLTNRQVAEQLSINEDTVRRRLKWINTMLRNDIEKHLNIDGVKSVIIIQFISNFLNDSSVC